MTGCEGGRRRPKWTLGKSAGDQTLTVTVRGHVGQDVGVGARDEEAVEVRRRRAISAGLLQEAARHLFEPVIAAPLRLRQDPLDVRRGAVAPPT